MRVEMMILEEMLEEILMMPACKSGLDIRFYSYATRIINVAMGFIRNRTICISESRNGGRTTGVAVRRDNANANDASCTITRR